MCSGEWKEVSPQRKEGYAWHVGVLSKYPLTLVPGGGRGAGEQQDTRWEGSLRSLAFSCVHARAHPLCPVFLPAPSSAPAGPGQGPLPPSAPFHSGEHPWGEMRGLGGWVGGGGWFTSSLDF